MFCFIHFIDPLKGVVSYFIFYYEIPVAGINMIQQKTRMKLHFREAIEIKVLTGKHKKGRKKRLDCYFKARFLRESFTGKKLYKSIFCIRSFNLESIAI